MRLHPQSDHAGHNERCSPYQVEIEPGLAKNREYKLAIDHPCDDPSDSKIGSSMDRGGEQCCQAGGYGYGDLPCGQPLRLHGCPATPQATLNQYCAPMPSETTRPSSRESPSACGPIAGGDAAPGSRFQDRTKAPRRDSGLPSGQRHAEKCRAKNHAANGQGVAKRDRRAHSRSNKLLGAGSARAPSQRHL